jgi:hypothetical protein
LKAGEEQPRLQIEVVVRKERRTSPGLRIAREWTRGEELIAGNAVTLE